MKHLVFFISLFLAGPVSICSAQDSFDFSELDQLVQYIDDHPGVTMSGLPATYSDVVELSFPESIAADKPCKGYYFAGLGLLGIGWLIPAASNAGRHSLDTSVACVVGVTFIVAGVVFILVGVTCNIVRYHKE